MEVGMLIMSFCVKITLEIDKNDNWLNALDTVNELLMDKDIYPTGPIIFQRELAGLGKYKYTAHIALNDELQDIPGLNIKYTDCLEVGPMLSTKCFEEEESGRAYKEIEYVANENNIKILNQPYYRVMVDYFGGTTFEIYVQVDLDESEICG